MVINFYGSQDATLDSKSRFILPSMLKKKVPVEAGVSFVMVKGFDQCVYLYPQSVWEEIALQLQEMDEYDIKNRAFKKRRTTFLYELEMDSQFRLLISKPLADFAGLKKDLFLYGNGKKIEIWDKEIYNQHLEKGYEQGNDEPNEDIKIAREYNIKF